MLLEDRVGLSKAGMAIVEYGMLKRKPDDTEYRVANYGSGIQLDAPVELLPGRTFYGTMKQREHDLIHDGLRFAHSHGFVVQAIHDRVLPWSLTMNATSTRSILELLEPRNPW